MRLPTLLAALSVAAFAQVAAADEYNPARRQPATPPGQSVQRILVKLRSPDSAARLQAQAAESTMRALATRVNIELRKARHIAGGLHVMQVAPKAAGESMSTTLTRLRADAAVEYAEPDRRRYPHAVPNDPLFVNQWYMQNAQPSAIDAVAAWDLTIGRDDVVIAVLDTGVRLDHPDLGNATADRFVPGYDFVSDDPGGGFLSANDGDGRDPDPSDPGDWISQEDADTAQFSGCPVSDSSWHGTRVSGILGALTDNAEGVAGITWSARLLPVRVLGKCGGYDSDVLAGMLWAAGLPVDGVPLNPNPAHIINMSLGGAGACSPLQQSVVDDVVATGALLVISAGNEGGPVASPANCAGVAGIAGLRQVGTKVGFSSLGPQIAVSAPGGNCVNVGAGDPCLFSIDTTSNAGTTVPAGSTYTNQFDINVGTSFSAPIVSGTAGLMLAVNGNLRSEQLIARLQEGATPFPVSSDPAVPNCRVPQNADDLQTAECNCTTQTCGAGMTNALGAVNAALRPVAAIMVPASVSPGQDVTLQAMGSAAACNRFISAYEWTVVDGGETPPAISGADTATATVVAPAAGEFTLRLNVTDDAGLKDSADVTISTAAATTEARADARTGACPAGTPPPPPPPPPEPEPPAPPPEPEPEPEPPPVSEPAPPSEPVQPPAEAPPPGSGGGGSGGGGPVDPLLLLACALAATSVSLRRRRG